MLYSARLPPEVRGEDVGVREEIRGGAGDRDLAVHEHVGALGEGGGCLLAARARWRAHVVAYGRVAPEPTAVAPLPRGVRLRKIGQCYRNAFELMLRDWSPSSTGPPTFRYVEGFAYIGAPIRHAWNITATRTVVDTTLRTRVLWCRTGPTMDLRVHEHEWRVPRRILPNHRGWRSGEIREHEGLHSHLETRRGGSPITLALVPIPRPASRDDPPQRIEPLVMRLAARVRQIVA